MIAHRHRADGRKRDGVRTMAIKAPMWLIRSPTAVSERGAAALPAPENPSPDVEILGERVLLTTRIFTIREAELRYRRFGPDRTVSGAWTDTVTRVNADRGDSVAAVVVDVDAGAIVLAEQFRYPTLAHGPGWLTELVAGMVDAGEDPETAIRREIREEIGYDVRGLERIATMYTSPGGSSERVILFYAEIDDALRVGDGGGLADESEDIARRTMPLDELAGVLDRGEITDAKTLAGLLWLRLRRQRPE
jgi:ADP-ribose pyrophosphatase